MVVEKGLEDVLTRIQEKKDSIDILDPDALKQLHFLEAAKLGNEAVLNYSNRLADKCEEEAGKTDDPEYKKELMELAEICRYVPFHPARRFEEAVQ